MRFAIFYKNWLELILHLFSFLVLTCFTFLVLQKSFHYIGLLKAVMRLSMSSLKAADAKEVASSVTAIANEKLKAEKEANAGKKKQGKNLVYWYYSTGTKKKQLHVDRAEDDYVTAGGYNDVDDYDFM
ncbi:hypothetical protein GW17_00032311 [Ensete ventricosum]|nr:hypothetical protein GW17_00032311 [Ensete ventricosum]